MKIFGIGTDIVNIKRIDHLLKKHGSGFRNRIFQKKKFIIVKEKKILPLFTQKDLLLKKHLVKH